VLATYSRYVQIVNQRFALGFHLYATSFQCYPTCTSLSLRIAFIFRMFGITTSQLRGSHGCFACQFIDEFQTSPDVRIRVRERIIRIRSRQTAQRAVIRITANVQQPHPIYLYILLLLKC
jgi:hypothetical protein